MPLTATGAFSLPLANLKTLLANCAAFQTWTGTADAAAAAARIDLFAEQTASLTLPGAVVTWGAQNSYSSSKAFGGEGGTYERTGTADIYFTSDLDTTYAEYASTLDNLMLAFCNDIGEIMDDMDALAGRDTYLDVRGWDKVAGPMRSGEEDTSKMVQMVVRVMWWGMSV